MFYLPKVVVFFLVIYYAIAFSMLVILNYYEACEIIKCNIINPQPMNNVLGSINVTCWVILKIIGIKQ